MQQMADQVHDEGDIIMETIALSSAVLCVRVKVRCEV